LHQGKKVCIKVTVKVALWSAIKFFICIKLPVGSAFMSSEALSMKTITPGCSYNYKQVISRGQMRHMHRTINYFHKNLYFILVYLSINLSINILSAFLANGFIKKTQRASMNYTRKFIYLNRLAEEHFSFFLKVLFKVRNYNMRLASWEARFEKQSEHIKTCFIFLFL